MADLQVINGSDSGAQAIQKMDSNIKAVNLEVEDIDISDKIKNNLTETVPGNALDAVQGKALAEQISILKGKVADVEDFGAHSIYEVGYENYDSIQAFKDAIAYLVTKKGGTLYVPNKYILSEQLTIANMDITIVGQSPQLSQIFFNGTNGIVYSSTNQFTDSIQIENLSIVTVADNIGNGIDISFPNNSGSPWENVYINNICVSSSTTIGDYNLSTNNSQTTINNWVNAININNCAVSKILNSIIRNPNGRGILINGSSTDMTIKDVNFYGCSFCIIKEGEGEGLWIENCKGINVNSFVYINSASVAQDGVYLVIKNCHSAYYLNAIVVKRMPQIEISGCLLYKYGDVGGGSDILIENSDIAHIHHNKLLVSTGTGKNNGITINGACNFIEIDNNFINERQVGVWVVSGTVGYIQIGRNNVFGGANNTKISDGGNNTIIDYAIQPSCKVRHNTSQNIPNATWTSLNFNTDVFDADDMHNVTTNNTRILCKSKGIYIISGNVSFGANNIGDRMLRFIVNGVNIGQSDNVTPTASGINISFSHIYNLNVGDYIELQAYQTSGGALEVVSASPFTPTFSTVRVSN